MKRLRFFRCRLLPFFCGRGVGPLRLCLPVPAVCLRFDVPASGKRSFRRALACRDGEAGFWPECLCSVRAAISRLATCPDACFSGLFLPRGDG